MAITYAQAETARAHVLGAVGIYLPSGLTEKVARADIRSIVKILPQAQYQIHFSDVFFRFFASTNVVAFGQTVDDPDVVAVPGMPRTQAPSGGSRRLIRPLAGRGIEEKLSDLMLRRTNALHFCNCPAFTSPAVDVLARKIYINADQPLTTIGTVYHEFVHYLQHANLYPEFYALGGKNIGILEGITEFFTRRIDPAITLERANGGRYQSYFDDVSRQIGTGMLKRNALIKYCFQGEPYLDLGGTRPRV